MYPKQVYLAQSLYNNNKDNFRDIKISIADLLLSNDFDLNKLDQYFNSLVIKDIKYITDKLEVNLSEKNSNPEFFLILCFVAHLCELKNLISDLQKNDPKVKKAILSFFESVGDIKIEAGFILKSLNEKDKLFLKKAYEEFIGQFAQAIVSSDLNITPVELESLNKIKEEISADQFGSDDKQEEHQQPNQKIANKGKATAKNKEEETESLEQILEELDSFVGMEDIKNDVRTLINTIKIQKMREAQNLSVVKPSLHMVFTGPPGTGKTTIARIMGRIFKALGVLESGHLVETDRAGLVAGYVGQTAIKADEQIAKAKNGVLFIDEAYTLSPPGGQDEFGQEAIDTILKRMEDYRESVVIIAAGYSKEMEGFIDSNPGFKSRFNKYIKFEDYKPAELMEIFQVLIKKNKYKATSDLLDELHSLFENLYSTKSKSFGNGRLVRNIFEKIVENQSNRLAMATGNLTKDDLQTLSKTDCIKM